MINESLFPTMTFYHGSPYKLDKILPTAFSAGNKLRDPEWAVFMFGKKEYAKYYAMSMVVQDTVKEQNKKQSELPSPRGWLAKNGINSYKFYGVVVDRVYDYVKSLCLGKKYYVYTLEVPINTKLDIIGTTSTLPEYTYAGIPKTLKVDEYTITEKEFDSLHRKVSQEEYDTIKKISPYKEPIVNKAFQMLQLDPYSREKNRRITRVLIKQGDLKPGDDLKFLNDSETYYRLTYKGEGIYNAVKRRVSNEEWKKLLKDPNINWIPKPPEYLDGYRSYFTKDGFSKFWDKSRKIIYNILDEDDIELDKKKISNKDIIYRDEYQVVVKHSLSESISPNNIHPVKEDTDMIFNEELEKGNNVIFSEDDIYCNMNKWDNHESHVLFILGLSASGKSTLSRKLAKKYKCNLIELDVITFAITGEKAHDKGRQTWEYIKKADHMLYKFMKEKGLEPDFMRHVESCSQQRPLLDKKDEREKQRWVDKYIHWVCFEQKERCVLEGGHACVTIANHKEYREFPIIFKGSSLLKSMIRRVKRTWIDDNKPMGPIELAKYLVIISKQYGKMFPEVNAARNAVITKDNFKIIKEYRDIVFDESTFISDKDLVWNFDKWKRGDINLLFICGYSGGGKSTLSRILAKKYNCPLSEMDMENQEIKKTYHAELSQYGPGGTFGNPKKMEFILNKYIERYGNKGRRIIEGVQLASVDFDFIKDYAVIFKGTSAVTASMRAWKRAFTDDENAERWAEDKSTLGKLKYKLQQGPNRLKTNINKVGPFMEKFYADMKKAGAKEMEYEDIVNPNIEDFHIPLFISGDDVYVNFDKWKEGKCNTLFILGLSGSGKSTLGKKLAKARKAFYVETDKIRGNSHYSDAEMRKDHPLILRWFESQYDKDRRGFNSLDKSIRKKEWDRCVEWMINQKEPKVIEGAIEEFLLEHPEYSEYPIVFKNTSMLKSIVRMTRRQLFEVDKSKVDDYNTQFLKWWLKHIQKYNDMRKRNNNVRDTIIGKKENSYEVMKESRTLKDNDVYFVKCKWEDGDKRGLVTNACKEVNGEVYRVRTEMLVVKDGKVLCVKDYHDNLGLGYKLPGGSVEKGISYAEQAAEEVKEEARIIIDHKTILNTGITYTRKYTKQPRWISHLTPPIPYVGGISYVYVGEYKSDFNGYIPDVHRDDGFYNKARFYDIDEIKWIPEHKKALDMYFKENMKKQDSKDTYENALKIFNSLTPKEQYWLDNRYVNSPNIFYRKLHFIGRKPVGFVDIYRFNPTDTSVVIVLAVNKAYRGKGIATELVKSATLYCKSKGIEKIIWRSYKDNDASIQLAKKMGYTKTKEDEKQYRFEKSL